MAKRGITARLAMMLFSIIGFSTITVVIAITFYLSSINDAEAINVAGSLRMQSYRLAHSFTYHPELLVEYQRTMSASFTHLGEIIDVIAPDSIHHQYQALHAQWFALLDVIQAQDYAKYNQYLPLFVDQIDAFVLQLQQHTNQKLHILAAMGGGTLLLIVLTVITTLQFSKRHIVAPLHQMVAASKSLSEGDFSTQLHLPNHFELTELANTMNTMSTSLAQLYNELEMKVEEKTHRLAHSNHTLQLLYECSAAMAQHPIKVDHFDLVLDKLMMIEGIRALKLTIITPNTWTLTKGAPSSTKWQLAPIYAEGRHLGDLQWQFDLPCPDQAQLLHACQLLARSVLITESQHNAQHLAMMEERSHIARELHDSLAQSLSFLKIQVSLLKRHYSAPPDALLQLEQGLNDAYTQLRELLTAFRLSLEDTPFAIALSQMLSPYQQQGNLIIENQVSQLTLDKATQPHLLHIIREAVANAIHHANASEITVNIHQSTSTLTAEITDNGIGFDPRIPVDKHYGLTIMNERAALVGANIAIESDKGQGTKITITCPINEEQ
ncbi:ATP-binding protein [Thaumasiovibrio subtropicus]|uniref:ATP-binding protein n=1 Tax=Thaumasiovibrio subtropicus TaxID=1891207 RepID=UPI00131C1C67|nr:ATP-binding protein [Thaumasiovibrio subtropicus]